MSQHPKKRRHLPSLTTGEPSPLLSHADGNRTEADARPYTPSQKTGDTLTYTRPPVPTSSNLISNASESDLIAAGVLASAIPSLLAAGLVKKVTVTGSRLILLGFDPDLWTEDYRLK